MARSRSPAERIVDFVINCCEIDCDLLVDRSSVSRARAATATLENIVRLSDFIVIEFREKIAPKAEYCATKL